MIWDPTVETVINEVRAIVKKFRRSPVKNDSLLTGGVMKKYGKELAVIRDCKTRLSSLHSMIVRFLTLKKPTNKIFGYIELH